MFAAYGWACDAGNRPATISVKVEIQISSRSGNTKGIDFGIAFENLVSYDCFPLDYWET